MMKQLPKRKKVNKFQVWTSWFAWRPVITENRELVWWESVQRLRMDGTQFVSSNYWIYRKAAR